MTTRGFMILDKRAGGQSSPGPSGQDCNLYPTARLFASLGAGFSSNFESPQVVLCFCGSDPPGVYLSETNTLTYWDHANETLEIRSPGNRRIAAPFVVGHGPNFHLEHRSRPLHRAVLGTPPGHLERERNLHQSEWHGGPE